MAMNMEVAEASELTSDARLSTSADSPDDANSGTHGGPTTLAGESLPRAGEDATGEDPVDARPTTSNGDATGVKCEEAAKSSSLTDNGPRVPQTPLAFTIDFSNKEVDTAKYQNLFERYNARHRRNLSMSKVLKIQSFLIYILFKEFYIVKLSELVSVRCTIS